MSDERGPELVIHGHFYQPPRENPWTEEVLREDSAAPFHDWNERIAAECYRPNSVARIVDEAGRVLSIIDNYEHMSYNVGPTLLSWLEREQPDTYARMIAGDRQGGGAIAQAFGHIILPLATEADIRTQVRWGLADFRYRFGREASGMWLPECAVDDRVLRILAEEGVGFTILAPSQAAQVRSLEGIHDWVDVQQSWLDTSRPYRWLHPENDGRGVDIVFYNGPLSQALAFEMSSLNSQALVDRMVAAGSGRPGLVTVATDGETFGHHHRYGDRLIAYAMAVEAPKRNLHHTNLNEAVSRLRPTQEVRVHRSAWSCVHGVGRWSEDCGCSTGAQAGWNQRWRGPLRSALDQLRAVVTAVYDRRAPSVLTDPTEAFDAYVDVLIGAVERDEFANKFVKGDAVEAFSLLEMQRYAMSMFTSCGWFFNDLAGIETVQVLRYAARVIDIIEELGETSPLGAFLAVLGEARSNVLEEGSGADIWKRHVDTARVSSHQVAEHVALSEVLENTIRSELGTYDIVVGEHVREERGSTILATGVAVLTHKRTGRVSRYAYAAIGLGGLEVSGSFIAVDSDTDSSPLIGLRKAFADGVPVTKLLRALSTVGTHEFDLSAALPEESERLMRGTAESLLEHYAGTYERLYDSHRATLEDLAHHGYPLTPVLRAPAELALARRFHDAVFAADASTNPAAYEKAVAIARQARAAGFEVDTPATTMVMQKLVTDVVARAAQRPTAKLIRVALDVLALKNELGVPVDIGPSQEAVYFALRNDGKEVLKPLAEALHIAP